jgi:hypothetical protein
MARVSTTFVRDHVGGVTVRVSWTLPGVHREGGLEGGTSKPEGLFLILPTAPSIVLPTWDCRATLLFGSDRSEVI